MPSSSDYLKTAEVEISALKEGHSSQEHGTRALYSVLRALVEEVRALREALTRSRT